MGSAVSQSFVLGNVKLDQVWMLQFKGGSISIDLNSKMLYAMQSLI